MIELFEKKQDESESEYYTPEELMKKLNMNTEEEKRMIMNKFKNWQVPGQVKVGQRYRARKYDVEKKLLNGGF